MSFITKLEGNVKTFAGWAEKELAKLEKDAPEIAKVTDSIVTYVGGAAAILATVEGGPAASAEVKALTSEVQSGIMAVSGLVTDFGATPTVATIASSLSANAAALLATAKVTNPTSVAAGTGIINNLAALAAALTEASTK